MGRTDYRKPHGFLAEAGPLTGSESILAFRERPYQKQSCIAQLILVRRIVQQRNWSFGPLGRSLPHRESGAKSGNGGRFHCPVRSAMIFEKKKIKKKKKKKKNA